MGSHCESSVKIPPIKFTKLFINGNFVDSISGKTFDTIDPRTGEVITKVSLGDREDVDLAVKAARHAFDYGPWPRISGSERGRMMMKFADLIEENAEEIAALDTVNGGKLFTLCKAIDIPGAARSLRYYAGAADKIHGTVLKMSKGLQGYTLREPIGVVGSIIPWNFPTIMFFMKAAPALAAGCTLVVKPAEQTPLSALYYAHLAKLAGIPDGVLNVVNGFGETAGAAISAHMDIDKVTFTGSTDVGRKIMAAAAASNLKPVSLELGGKSPLLIFDDADIDQAADIAFRGMFYNKGEICVASSRVYVQEGIYEKLVKKLVEKAKATVVGDPFDPQVNQGPQTDKKQFEKILSYIEHGKREGATLLTGVNQPSTSPHLGSQCPDLRDVVKDSMYREARGLLVKKTTREDILGSTVKHRDSPRPFQVPKSVDGSYGVRTNGKKNMSSADLKESLRVLSKLQEAPWYYNNEARQLQRSSCEANGLWNSTSRDTPRFSYDGREISRLSFESQDTFKSTPKLKEQSRLSLDSREWSMKGSKNLTKSFHNSGNSNIPPQSPGSQSRPANIVAKLMGLEPLPDHSSGVMNTCTFEDNSPFLQPLRTNNLNRPTGTSNGTRSSLKDPTSPRWKNPDMIMKPISSSRLPIEPAPWRHADGSRGTQKQPLKHVKIPPKPPNCSPSVYSEIEKRLKDLEFRHSGKDLRALKQILEAMQAKGLLDTGKEEQAANLVSQRDYEPKCTSPGQHPRGQRSQRGSDSIGTYESPIVIMKPAKLVEQVSMHASTVVPIDDISSLPKIQNGSTVDNKRGSISSRLARDHTSRNSQSTSVAGSTNKRASNRNLRTIQSSTKPPKESTASSVKSSGGSVSPRLQQKKLELDRRSRPPTPPSDPSKLRRQSNRHPLESGSPSGKRRSKSHNTQQCDDQLSQVSSESWTSSHQGDEISLQSDSNLTLESKLDTEVTSREQSIETNCIQSPSMNATKYSVSGIMQKKSTSRLVEDGSVAELAMVTPEQPSPVSVLDTSIYRDDAPSPVRQILNAPEGDIAEVFNDGLKEEQWDPADNCLLDNTGSGLVSEINRKKLQKIEHLVQKLRRLNSTHDEASTDYIASLCENTNPDHRYISEILLASGLLLRDLSSGLTTFQLHPSGHPINPELFLVLEQTKASSLLSKPDHEKLHRKLIFDSVNEILVGKLAQVGASPEPRLNPGKLTTKTLNAQKLLKELCMEIEQLQPKESDNNMEEEDGLKNILWEDVTRRSESWTNFNGEISGMVLDVERLVFKDLVNEIVIGEGVTLRAKQQQQQQQRRRRQLFSK